MKQINMITPFSLMVSAILLLSGCANLPQNLDLNKLSNLARDIGIGVR